MDTSKTPDKATALLNDLESIRALLDGDNTEPPLLVESMDPGSIPLLCEVVGNPPVHPVNAPPSAALTQPKAPPLEHPALKTAEPSQLPDQLTAAISSRVHSNQQLNQTINPAPITPALINRELRKAAELIMQEVIDDFVPQIEDELRRRLQIRLRDFDGKL